MKSPDKSGLSYYKFYSFLFLFVLLQISKVGAGGETKMIRHRKEAKKIIVQLRKNEFTDYRVIFYEKGRLKVINICDYTQVYRDEVWVESRHTYTKRTGKLYQYMTKNKSYCGLTEKRHIKEGINPKILTDTISKIINGKDEFYTLTDKECWTWTKYIGLPLVRRNINPHKIKYDAEIPF